MPDQVKHYDSVRKLLIRLGRLARVPVVYNGETLTEGCDRVTILPNLGQKFICASGCTACCARFTIDFLDSEWHDLIPPQNRDAIFKPRIIEVNEVKRTVYSYDQGQDERCPYLIPIPELNGDLGCSWWPTSPLECQATPQVGIKVDPADPRHTIVGSSFFKDKDGWGFGPPKCAYGEDGADLDNVVMLLSRYHRWAMEFNVPNHFHEVFRGIDQLKR